MPGSDLSRMNEEKMMIELLAALAETVSTTPTPVEPSPASDTSLFVFNTMLFLISGMVVMFMAAGFSMLEVGLVRSKNAAAICVKNIALYAVAGLMVWITGYNLIYGISEGGIIGQFGPWHIDDTTPMKTGSASASVWFFQMVFVATAASIVSGTLAERIKLWPFMAFVAVLTGIIYPIQAGWVWGEGWLDKGFDDFAGSTLVHSTGGWAALAGALVLGPRRGKYSGGRINAFPGSSLPLATLGTFILWLGWFGFNGGSQLAMGTLSDAMDVSKIMVNTNMAASGGVVAAMIIVQMKTGKVDLTMVLNGAIGGLVSITAEPLQPAVWQAVLIGAVGGTIVVYAVPLLDKLKIDDVVGAIPAHLMCGIWGTLIVPLTNHGVTFFGQLLGVVTIGAFVFLTSLAVWFILHKLVGLRVSDEVEHIGLDKAELGLEAYPEFKTN